jgi:hypothetical protein
MQPNTTPVARHREHPDAGSRDGKGLGSTKGSGICHAYARDGRCISLLKILMTNYCVYDCAYCVNRVSSNVPRARFTVDEVVWLTTEFCRRNYIEGLFLSSGVLRSSDYTMEEMVRIAEKLRAQGFRGYIHLKTIPGAIALHALTGDGSRVLKRRGGMERTRDGRLLLVTLHPSCLLRLPESQARDRATEDFRNDLVHAVEMLRVRAG